MFFFISWGSRTYQRLFGAPEQHHCDICKEDRTFRNVVTYKVYHILWLFRWVVYRSYARVCMICRNGPQLPASQFEVKGAVSPIPFMDRMGWTVGVGGVAALALMGFVAISNETQADAAALARPAAGDVYEVDLAKLQVHPEAPEMYSTMLVTRVSADTVEVRLPKTYFNRMSGTSAAVSDGRAKSSAFYGDEVLTFKLASLPQMQKDSVILHVDR
jgi:hypothetical protein